MSCLHLLIGPTTRGRGRTRRRHDTDDVGMIVVPSVSHSRMILCTSDFELLERADVVGAISAKT